jgi:hypothetical protein
MAIIVYRIDQTGPNSQLGGAHVGLIKFWYQEYVCIS